MLFENNSEDLMLFAYHLREKIKGKKTPVFLCVGSDKWVCDSLAPMVAEILKEEYKINAYVYGGLRYNINATNLMEAVHYIECVHSDRDIILIDATIGEDVGKVKLVEGSYAGMGRCLPIKKVGVLSILGVVARGKVDFSLNCVRLGKVVGLSRFIAKGCFLAVSSL